MQRRRIRPIQLNVLDTVELLDKWTDTKIRVLDADAKKPVTSHVEAEFLLNDPDGPFGHSIAVGIEGTNETKRIYAKQTHRLFIEGKEIIFNTRKGQEVIPIQKHINAGDSFGGTHFENMELAGINARNANFAGAVFENTALALSHFEDADLRGAKFVGCDLYRADFRGAKLDNVTFENCNLSGCDFSKTTGQGVIAKNNIYNDKTQFSPATPGMLSDYSSMILHQSLPKTLTRGLITKIVPHLIPYVFILGATAGYAVTQNFFTTIGAGVALAWFAGKVIHGVLSKFISRERYDDFVVGVTKNVSNSFLQRIYARICATNTLHKAGKDKGLLDIFVKGNTIICPKDIAPAIDKIIAGEVKDMTIIRFGTFGNSRMLGQFSDDKDPDIIRVRNGETDMFWTNNGVIEQHIHYDKDGKFVYSDVLRGETYQRMESDEMEQRSTRIGNIKMVRCLIPRDKLLAMVKDNVQTSYGLSP